MIRLFYRHMRRTLYRISEDDKNYNFVVDISKWWFDNARNLIVSALFAFQALRTGSWLAYTLMQISFTFFVLFLFHPIFRFIMRASSGPKQQKSRYATVVGMCFFLSVFGFAVAGAYGLIWALAGIQER